MKGPLRDRSLGTKLTEVEYARVESAALRAGVGLSEWCRRAVLNAADRDDSQPPDGVLLAELLALRAVLLVLAVICAVGGLAYWLMYGRGVAGGGRPVSGMASAHSFRRSKTALFSRSSPKF